MRRATSPDCAFSLFCGAASGDVVGFCDLGLAAVGFRDVGPVPSTMPAIALRTLGFMLTVIDQSTLRQVKVLITCPNVNDRRNVPNVDGAILETVAPSAWHRR